MRNRTAIVIFSGRQFGGAERRFCRLASYLIKCGADLQLVCTADSMIPINNIGIDFPEFNAYGDNSIILIDSLSIGNIFYDKFNRFLGVLKLNLLLKDNFSYVHFAMNPGLVPTLLSFTGIKYSISVVDYNLNFNNYFLKRSIENAQAVDCLSDTICDDLRRKCAGFQIPPFFVSPCSFTDTQKVEDVLDSRSILDRDIDVSLIARHVPGKGHDLFKEALGKLPKVKYFMDSTDEPFEILRRSKIFLALQEKENYPSQALLEAIASGCAIIATDVGETRKLLDDSCAVLIPYDADRLSDAILFLLDDAAKRRDMAEIARRKVFKDHTVERFADYFLEFLKFQK